MTIRRGDAMAIIKAVDILVVFPDLISRFSPFRKGYCYIRGILATLKRIEKYGKQIDNEQYHADLAPLPRLFFSGHHDRICIEWYRNDIS